MILDKLAFLIGHYRCGTHFLGYMIGSHPDVGYLDEITTYGRSSVLTKQLKTTRALIDWCEAKFGDREEDVLLLDCKYEHLKIIRPLEYIVADGPCVQIIRRDKDAWYYSYRHAMYRKEHGLAEYGDTPKEEATPNHAPPTIEVNEDKRLRLINEMTTLERRYVHLADTVLFYEDLTDNEDTKTLEGEPVERICDTLSIPYHRLTTTMTKMSPTNPKEYLK